MKYKVGDKLILHSQDKNDYYINVVNINEFRPPNEIYGVDMFLNDVYYGDVYFCGEDFLDKCELLDKTK